MNTKFTHNQARTTAIDEGNRSMREGGRVHLLYTDEVNVDPDNTEFFVYAGTSIPGENAAALSSAIEQLRRENGYRPGDILKFNTRERPPHVTPPQHQNAKRALMEVAAQHGVKLFASFLLHNIAQNTGVEQARWNEINRVCLQFQSYLARIKCYGLVLVDMFTDAALNNVLREKFSIGLKGLPFSKTFRLDRILAFHLATIGTSHFTSVIDVALGSLRYAVNQRKEDKPVCKTLLGQLAPLCIAERNGRVSELSINFSPKAVRNPAYLMKYKELSAFLQRNGIHPAVEPS